jgi:hypothetical protein
MLTSSDKMMRCIVDVSRLAGAAQGFDLNFQVTQEIQPTGLGWKFIDRTVIVTPRTTCNTQLFVQTPARRLKYCQERSGCAGRPTDLLSKFHAPIWLPTQLPTIPVRRSTTSKLAALWLTYPCDSWRRNRPGVWTSPCRLEGSKGCVIRGRNIEPSRISRPWTGCWQ